jgi:hypothetical protein
MAWLSGRTVACELGAAMLVASVITLHPATSATHVLTSGDGMVRTVALGELELLAECTTRRRTLPVCSRFTECCHRVTATQLALAPCHHPPSSHLPPLPSLSPTPCDPAIPIRPQHALTPGGRSSRTSRTSSPSSRPRSRPPRSAWRGPQAGRPSARLRSNVSVPAERDLASRAVQSGGRSVKVLARPTSLVSPDPVRQLTPARTHHRPHRVPPSFIHQDPFHSSLGAECPAPRGTL